MRGSPSAPENSQRSAPPTAEPKPITVGSPWSSDQMKVGAATGTYRRPASIAASATTNRADSPEPPPDRFITSPPGGHRPRSLTRGRSRPANGSAHERACGSPWPQRMGAVPPIALARSAEQAPVEGRTKPRARPRPPPGGSANARQGAPQPAGQSAALGRRCAHRPRQGQRPRSPAANGRPDGVRPSPRAPRSARRPAPRGDPEARRRAGRAHRTRGERAKATTPPQARAPANPRRLWPIFALT